MTKKPYLIARLNEISLKWNSSGTVRYTLASLKSVAKEKPVIEKNSMYLKLVPLSEHVVRVLTLLLKFYSAWAWGKILRFFLQ